MPEGNETMIFRFVAHLAKTFVVAILLTAAGIAPGRLQMTVCLGRDPYVGIGRWDRERLDAQQFRLVGNGLAVGMEIREMLAAFLPRDTGVTIVEVAQPGFTRGQRWIE